MFCLLVFQGVTVKGLPWASEDTLNSRLLISVITIDYVMFEAILYTFLHFNMTKPVDGCLVGIKVTSIVSNI